MELPRREAIEAHTLAAPRLPLRGRRGCSDAVIQWAARSAASLSQRHFCARQAGAAIHRSSDEQDPGSGNYRGVFGAATASSPLSLFHPPTGVFLFCKDERRPPRPGVHLPGGRLRGKMSLFPFSFSSANCGVKWCTAVVGLAARCGSRRKWLRERRSAALREGGVMRVSAFDAATLMLGFFSFLLPPPLQV